MIEGKGVYIGTYKHEWSESTGFFSAAKQLSRVFDIYAAPTDVKRSSKYNELIDAVAGIENLEGHSGTRIETEIRLREGVKTFSVLGDQKSVIGDYLSARDENYGTNTSYKTITAEADSYKLNKDTGVWEKSGTETRTFVIFN